MLALVPVGLAARRVRRRLLPGGGGGDALLADVVIGLAAMVLVAEVIGTVGWFGTPGVVVALFATSMAVLLTVGDAPPTADREPPASTLGVPRWHLVAGVVAVAPVVASWMARAIRVFDEGIRGSDTVWYHLPAAVRFLQSGRTTTVQFFDDGPVTAYFPMTSSLLHSIGMALFGSDLLSAFANAAALGLALLAAWRFGARFGVAVPAAVAVALLLGSPLLVETQAATALNDAVGVALLLAAVAAASQVGAADRTVERDVVTGLALGLAIGMKVTFLVPAGLLAVGLIVTAGRGRWLRSVLVFGLTAATGVYWYVRNVVATGSPIPVLDAGLGPIRFEAVTGSPNTKSVSAYLFDGDAWRDYLVPGFEDALGPLWFVLLVLVAVGLVGGALRPATSPVRVLAMVGIASLVAFVFTPQYLDLGEGKPFFFATNLRYAAPAFAIGALLSAVVLRRWMAVVLPGLVVATLVAQADPAVWPILRGRESFFSDHIDKGSSLMGAVLVGGVLIAVLVAGRLLARADRRPPTGALVLGASLMVLLAVAAGHTRYTDHRYRTTVDREGLYPWSQDVRDARIGSIGLLGQTQYPLTGPDLENHVDYLVVHTSDGGARPPSSCQELVDLIETGRYDHVVVLGSKLVEWVATQPDARPIPGIFPTSDLPRSEWVDQVFELEPDRTDRHC